MRVEIGGDAFTEDGFGLIVTLMQHFVESRHIWVVDPGQLDLVDGYFRDHAPKRSQTYGLLARKGLVSQAWTGTAGSRPRTVTITGESLADHVWDLGKSARFVVENQEGDRAFVLALAHVFDADGIVEACAKGWLEFVQGGGSGEVPKVVKNEGSSFRRVKRVAFLLDSDRLTPGAPSKHDSAVEKLSESGLAGHVLRFREAENYVPNRVLAAAAGRRGELASRIDCLKSLNPDQRAHFDFKNGFSDRRNKCVSIPDVQRELYGQLSEQMKIGLRNGFGEGLTLLLEREAKAGNIDESDFSALGPAVCQELRELLALIREII
ncbi:hypothetical protein [Planomonospora sp. ID82291]|uniref:hypothetical protein n=1 Tax=Planomonospora sp. ID82291 TaxID=2738136 RepID=UPI0018C3E0CD|nr:hypothetical protein [Planomonospora sp. ID82291]MBG0813846.1 hypothetical protein [Planomonospora sp. ID82291]